MKSKWQQLLTRPRNWLLALLGVLVTAGLSFGINQAIIRYKLSRPDAMTDIPVVNTDTGQGGVVTEVAFVSDGGGDNGRSQLTFRLSQGQEEPGTVPSIPVAAGDPLTDAEIRQILNRLSALTADEGDQLDFRLPDELIPPPRPGATIDEPFPPPAPEIPPDVVPDGPLEALRYSPEGEIPLAPFLNVTFNQPMVPLTTHEALTAADVPIKITPELPGTWQWLGTKTLSFEYDSTAVDRLPMATEYTVEIPVGTKSATGGTLAETVSWTFSTPPVRMENYYPSGDAQPLEPLFFASFDQLIDAQAVLNTMQVTADGKIISVQMATEAEIAADKTVSRMVENAGDGRTLAFRAQQSLPADANINVTIGPGAPSAEGPRLTTEAQTFSFQTYPPLRIIEHHCGWYDGDCPPLTPFTIEFNNPIDTEVYDESMLQINPELPGANVNIFGGSIQIQGVTQGRTTYRVRVGGDIQDVFGQTMGQDELLTFKVGSAPEFLSGPDQPFITLDPSATKPVFTVYSINYDKLHVRAYAVTPSDWKAYRDYSDRMWEDPPPAPPGEKVMDETIAIGSEQDMLTETAVDLTKALNGDTGHLIVIVEPPESLLSKDRYDRHAVQAWVQVTQIGLDAFVDHSQMVVWANALQDGAPLSGVTVRLEPNGRQATTGSDGTTRLDLSSSGASYLVAQQGDDSAMLPNNPYYWDDYGWRVDPPRDELRWYVFDDRQMYRPGEEVHVKGWIRQVGGKQDGDVGLFAGGETVAYTLIGPQGNEILIGQAQLNALGGFDLAFTLPRNTNLGYANLQLSTSGGEHYHNFQIQEFRRPEFEVTARNETTGPYFVNDYAVVATSANYFAGGPLPNAEVTWNVASSPSSYAPPNWSDFTFGTWTPWWWFDYGYEMEMGYFGGPDYGEGSVYETFSGVTDAAGDHFLRLDFDEMVGTRPFTIMADATVMDVNRQAWTAGTTLLVHPADLYVGIRSQRTFVERGKPLEIEAIVTDLDGNPVTDRPIQIRAARQEWKYGRGSWSEEEVDVQECTVGSAEEPVTCTFETEIGGSYLITAVITDDQGRQNQSQFTRWVSGGSRPPARNVEQETVTLIPDKESYQPGDTAEILVLAPFSPAEGLLTIARSGILTTERFQMSEGSYTLRVVIEDAHIPNLNVQVDLVGASPRTNADGEAIADIPPRPAYASGTLNLSIPPHSRTLSVEAVPQDSKLEPGGETTIDVTVLDADGRPVADAELAVVVVDEAILALSNYQLADPLAVFYSNRPAWLNGYYSRANIVLANPESLSDQVKNVVEVTRVVTDSTMQTLEEAGEVLEMEAMPMAVPMEDAAFGAVAQDAAPQPIQVRSNFDPLATFAPTVHTDSDGRAKVTVQLPDNLTRYRVMVVAVADGKQFGAAESNLTARLPLMVRPSAPRFLNFGDQFELPVVIQNQTDEPMEVEVVAQVTNLELTAGAGQRVTVPANDRVEVRFPTTTADPGTARIQVAAVSGSYADAATIELPVYTPATTEAFATYGVIDDGAAAGVAAVAQPVLMPDNVFTQFGGLEISTSSTALQALTDAVLYLTNYPYQCSEQSASRIMAIAALRDVLTAFEADGLPTPSEMETAVLHDIERLQGLQNYDGGFPVWERGKESIPYHSIYVIHALNQAKAKGFAVPEQMLQGSFDYLRNIESYYPSWYGAQTRRSLSAYALYTRSLMFDVDTAKAQALFHEVSIDEWSLEGLAWLWPILDAGSAQDSAAVYQHLQNRVVETAVAANFTTSYGDEAYLMLHSNRRTDGLILDALIRLQPDSDLIPKVVNGLLAHRVQGRWNNTQENTFILLALDRYFNTFEAETPDFVARIWLGETYAGDHAFVGRTTERHQTDIPMSYLFDSAPDGAAQDLILSKEGPGRLYYRLGLSYAPTDLSLDALDRGFIVQRTYEALDDPDDVTQDEEGVWHIKAGARVRVNLTMVAGNRRYHVALVDPLPAGLEIVNPALAVSGDVPSDPGQRSNSYWWWWNWYQHQNMRDERAEAFTTLLWEGVYDYSYIARATTPGTFIVPPAKAEEMYSPEVFGRSASDWVVVE